MIGGIRCEYISIKPEHFFGIAEVWEDQNFRVSITDEERTVLGLFGSPQLFDGRMDKTLAAIEEHVS